MLYIVMFKILRLDSVGIKLHVIPDLHFMMRSKHIYFILSSEINAYL